MKFRHEVKHIISYSDKITIYNNLKAVASSDQHTNTDNSYIVRSLYFDNFKDKALYEKINGYNEREKFRIRMYNRDTSFIRLEKKYKINGVGKKTSVCLTEEEVKKILKGDTSWMVSSGNALLIEFYSKMKSQILRPKTIVEYHRTVFTYEPGNTRITIDDEIRTGLNSTDF